MDTVKSSRDSQKPLLTMIFTEEKLFLAFLLNRCTKGAVRAVFDRLEKRKNEGLTTPKQIRFLESRGFQHVGTWQFDNAKHLIDRIAANGWHIPFDIDPSTYTGV